MKTSNKLLITLGIGIVLGIFSYAFIMRGAYQKALENPLSADVKVGLKSIKYLNLIYNRDITFKYGNKFEIQVGRTEADSLIMNYKNDTLNLDVTKIGDITIFLPDFPITKFIDKGEVAEENKTINYDDYRTVYVDSSFKSGNFVATFQQNGILNFTKCQLDKIDVKGKENLVLNIEKSSVKQLNLDLMKFSSLAINHSVIQSKNIVLGDSCNVSFSGKDTRSIFLK
ncbi:MAG: hypothetical protein V4585_20760 [Bacteroidota bacterium]